MRNPALLGSSIKDGFVVYGGIIGGILTAWIYCKCTKWNFWKVFDIAMPAVAMAQGFGADWLPARRLLLRNRAGSRKPDRDRVPQFRGCTERSSGLFADAVSFPVCWILQTASCCLHCRRSAKDRRTGGELLSDLLIASDRFAPGVLPGRPDRGKRRGVFHVAVHSLPVYLSDRVFLYCFLDFQFLQKRKELCAQFFGGMDAGFCIGEADFAGGDWKPAISSRTSLPSASLVADEIFDDLAGDL